MKRILILGNCGAGKTTLAYQIQKRTGLELVHLDQEYWQAGWVETHYLDWREKVEQLAAKGTWIMDGNYRGTFDIRLPAADTVIFLDRSRWLCLFRAVKRILRYYGKTRPDMGVGCPERFDWEFLKYIYQFPELQRPKIWKHLEMLRPDQQFFHLKNQKELALFLTMLNKELGVN
ncbi:MAG: AAA family ATPase [Bacteroidota bacterium]